MNRPRPWFAIAVAAGLLPGLTARGEGRSRPVDRPAGYCDVVVFPPDHKTIALTEEDHSLRLVDFKSGVTTGFLRGATSQVSRVAFSADGLRIATGGWGDRSV